MNITEFIKSKYGTIATCAKRTSLSESMLKLMCKGKFYPTRNAGEAIADYFNISTQRYYDLLNGVDKTEDCPQSAQIYMVFHNSDVIVKG
ncbi:MAG: hypothetical protein EOM87_09715 [Clostridia bacterium]|nr:hypothetical protein [Clostridia bacterium]